MVKSAKIYFLGLISLLSCNKQVQNNHYDFDIEKFYIKEVGFRSFNSDSLHGLYPNKLIKFKIDSAFGRSISPFNGSTTRQFFYYSVLDTTKLYSLIVYEYSENKYSSFDLYNVDKSGKLIDSQTLFYLAFDEDRFDQIESSFLSQNTLEQASTEGYFVPGESGDSMVIENEKRSIIWIKSNGEILKDEVPEEP